MKDFPGTLDPEMTAALKADPGWSDEINQVWCKDLERMRILFNQGRRFWNDGKPELLRVRDLQLPLQKQLAEGGRSTVPLRLYAMTPESELRPALFFLHGGGYVVGNLDTHDVICRQMAKASGQVVIAIDYAKSPEEKFPRALNEILSVVRTFSIPPLAAKMGVDAARLAIGGDSAGAALSMAALISEPKLFKAGWLVYGAFGDSDTPSRQLYSGPEWGLTPEYRKFYREAYYAKPEDAMSPLAQPLRAESFKGLPPVLLQPALLDPLRDDSYLLAERLKADGVPAKVTCYLGCYHGFLHMGARLKKARQAIDEAAGFLKETLAA